VRQFILEIDIYRYRRKIKWKGGIHPSFFLWRAKTAVRREAAGELGGMWSELVPE
jgi:hypothetical protein